MSGSATVAAQRARRASAGKRPLPMHRITRDGVVYVTISEAARVLGLSRRSARIYTMLAADELRSVKLDGLPYQYLRLADVEAYRTRRDGWLRLHGRRRSKP